MIIDTHLHPTNLVDEAWRHTGEPFTGERMLKLMDVRTTSTASRVASIWVSSSRLRATPDTAKATARVATASVTT